MVPMPGTVPITNRLAGACAIAFFLIHGVWHALYGFMGNLLWACHLGALLVGLGLLFSSAGLNAAGVLWLSTGTPLWFGGLFAGATLFPTSVLTHVGGLAIGLYGVQRLGFPRGVWWKTLAGLAVLHVASRWMTPEDKNVNAAMGIWNGLDRYLPSHELFLAAVAVACAALFFGLERGLGRLFGVDRGESARIERPQPGAS